ncbi:MAG: pyruvate kinase alpha/beta domain-containing protein [Limisphaerales bacterium]
MFTTDQPAADSCDAPHQKAETFLDDTALSIPPEPATSPLSKSTELTRDPGLRVSRRKTKLIVALDPGSTPMDAIPALIRAGVDGFQIQLDPVDNQPALRMIYALRSSATAAQRQPAILLTSPDTGVEAHDRALAFASENGADWLALGGLEEEAERTRIAGLIAERGRSRFGLMAWIEGDTEKDKLEALVAGLEGVIVGGAKSGSDCGGDTAPTLPQKVAHSCWLAGKSAWLTVTLDGQPDSAVDAPADDLERVAAAIRGRAEAVILCGLTCPVKAMRALVEAVDRMAAELERSLPTVEALPGRLLTAVDEAVTLAVSRAGQVEAGGLLVFSRDERFAQLCAALRPGGGPIVVFTPNVRMARRLRLRYGLEPLVLDLDLPPKRRQAAARSRLLANGLAVPGARLVVFQGEPGERSKVSEWTLD